MSLIRVRRERKAEHTGPNRPPRLWRLVIGFILVLLLIYYLTRFV
jgi:hypothetical protein